MHANGPTWYVSILFIASFLILLCWRLLDRYGVKKELPSLITGIALLWIFLRVSIPNMALVRLINAGAYLLIGSVGYYCSKKIINIESRNFSVFLNIIEVLDICCILYLFFSDAPIYRVMLLICLITLIIINFSGKTVVSKIFDNKLGFHLGTISQGIYFGHMLILVKYGLKAPYPLLERPAWSIFLIITSCILYGVFLMYVWDKHWYRIFRAIKNIFIKGTYKIAEIEPAYFSGVIIGVSFLLERDFFSFNNMNARRWLTYIVVKAIFIVLCIVIPRTLHTFLLKLKNKQIDNRKVKLYLIFIGIYVGLAIITWPGNWNNDELLIMKEIQEFDIQYHQSIFTSVFYMLSMMLIPDAGGIVLWQGIIWGISSAYIVDFFMEKSKKAGLFISFVMVSPPVLYFILYPLRMGLYTILLMVLFIKFMKKEESYTITKVLLLGFLIALVSLWRFENYFMLIIAPVMFFCTKKIKAKEMGICLLIGISILFINNKMQTNYSDPKVEKTAMLWNFETRLSVLLNEDLDSDDLERDLININNVMPVEKLKEANNGWDLFAVQDKVGMLEFSEEEYKKFICSTANLIVRNPVKYIKVSWPIFEKSAGLDKTYAWMPTARNQEEIEAYYSSLAPNLPIYFRAIMPKIREGVIWSLTGMFLYNEKHIVYHYIWNAAIPILLLFITTSLALLQRRWITVTISACLMLNFAIVYLTAPTVNVMYFFPFYLGGYICSISNICEIGKKKTAIKVK